MLAIVIEPHRSLSEWWLLRAREVDRHPTRVPVLDLLYPATSVLVVVLQYLGSLLYSAGAARLRLVWGYEGFESFPHFCSAKPRELRGFRRLLLVVSVGMYRRHRVWTKSWSLRVLQFVDTRVSQSKKDELGLLWDGLGACCGTPGVARQLRNNGIASAMLRECTRWQQCLLQWARVILMQVADLEWRHGRSRGRSDALGQTRLQTFVAESVSGEASILHSSRDALAAREIAVADGAGDALAGSADPPD